ncbi:hypothetical protein GCM10028796_52480 [Ramlibacter monticola]|uniref:Uncharacterized protein n=1 Tax=Ramlibacter monticola TaxID=1926872 RepID=A0A936Z1J7_9BURK|nr:hypothetical protein [Ramlibacter monticola]MBL0392066.1 hypothetical protein [Ramlibacter monticola]
MLHAWGHFVPWIVLAVIMAISIEGSRREAATVRVDLTGSQAQAVGQEPAAVRCDLRHGFVLRLAMYAQLMVHKVVPGDVHAQHTHGATCRVQP